MRQVFQDLVWALKLKEDIRRFRARRRLCWIGQRDSGSALSRLPTDTLKKLVPYFALPGCYALLPRRLGYRL